MCFIYFYGSVNGFQSHKTFTFKRERGEAGEENPARKAGGLAPITNQVAPAREELTRCMGVPRTGFRIKHGARDDAKR